MNNSPSQLNNQQITRTITDGVLELLGQEPGGKNQGSGFRVQPDFTEH